ncbi:MAG: pyridoxamine 5'-phosphate oxidase family protein [bacterium]|jgi:hypothetical protein
MKCQCGETGCGPVLSPENKEVICNTPFLTLCSLSSEGKPHMIVVRKAIEVTDEIIMFNVHKMNVTRSNISETGFRQVIATVGKTGYRLTGTASHDDSTVTFKVHRVDSLL